MSTKDVPAGRSTRPPDPGNGDFLSYSGMEMNAVHVSSLRDPARQFPRSMFLAMGLVLLIFIPPALAISWIVPAEELSLTAGIMQAFDAVLAEFGIQWLTPVLGVMLVTASLGGMLTWLASPSRGLLLISRQEGYLPPFLQRLNKHGVQQNILVTQGLITTVIALGYALIPDVSSAYWIFSVITTQVYLIMYLLMFVAAARLRRRQPDHPRGYRAPMLVGLCGVGFAASLAALLIGFIPPSRFGSGDIRVYLLIVGVALVAFGSTRSDARAEEKADQYLAELSAHGLRTPAREQVVQVLGDDGGALCADPASALNRAVLYGTLTNGAGGPGARPVIADNNVLRGQLLAIEVYCPAELEKFTEVADGLKYADVARG